MKTKVLFDTDIGSDIDDAVCLAYLLKQPKCDLLGITTVSGEADKRAMIASAICKAAQKDIPIYPGIENPLFEEQKQPVASQARALKNWEHKIDFPKGEAIEFMRKTIRNNPGEVTLLAVGPFTNIAMLFKVDPEIPSLLKQLVVMGGVFEFKNMVWPAEWNAYCDPHATSILYNTPVKNHKSVGLDVTSKVVKTKKEILDLFKSDILKPVVDFASVWFEDRQTLTFHDPLAATTIFDDKICEFKKGNVDIELNSSKLKGMTIWQPDPNGAHDVALAVDKQRFFDHYFDIVNK